MSVRRHVVLALVLAITATGGVAWQASAATPGGTLRLVCPLH